MITVKLTGIAAALMCLSALFQVVAWIGGAPGGVALYACIAAWYAVLWWRKDKDLSERQGRVA
jgi:hypothetical protein